MRDEPAPATSRVSTRRGGRAEVRVEGFGVCARSVARGRGRRRAVDATPANQGLENLGRRRREGYGEAITNEKGSKEQRTEQSRQQSESCTAASACSSGRPLDTVQEGQEVAFIGSPSKADLILTLVRGNRGLALPRKGSSPKLRMCGNLCMVLRKKGLLTPTSVLFRRVDFVICLRTRWERGRGARAWSRKQDEM